MCVFILALDSDLVAQSKWQIVNQFRRGNLSFVARNCDAQLEIEIGGLADTIAQTRSHKEREVLLERIWSVVAKSEINRGELKSARNGNWLLVLKSFNSDGELESESAFIFEFVYRKRRVMLRRILLAG